MRNKKRKNVLIKSNYFIIVYDTAKNIFKD